MKTLIDIYFDKDKNTITKWIKNKKEVFSISETFYPKIYVAGCFELKSKIESLPYVKDIHIEKKRIWPSSLESVMCIEIEQRELYNISKMLENRGCRIYNVDIGPARKYIVENDIFPFAKLKNFVIDDDKNLLDYELPDIKCGELLISSKEKKISLNSPICKISLGNIVIDGKNENEIIEEFYSEFIDQNIDLIFTNNGDSFELPYLYHRASLHGIRLRLGREKDRINTNIKGKSYFSYGRIYYKPNGYYLSGRLHIDKSSFLFREGGLLGLIDISRITGIPLQELSRLSPGSAIAALEMNTVLQDDMLIPWKRNIQENWKTAEQLLIADRGALTLEPKIGLHEDVWELDFNSMFPNIMLNNNISPETVLCECCSESSKRVPFINYNICEKNIGLIPKVLKPLLERRMEYKKRIKIYENENKIKANEYEMKQNVLKWLLVTSFGYMGFNKARFGRIECHESITAYARDILLTTKEIAEDMGFDIIHGIVDSLWIKGNNPERLCEIVTDKIKIPIEIKGKFNWIVFLPNKTNSSGSLNKYYGAMTNNKLKIRGVEARRSDMPILIKNMQTAMINKLAEAVSEKEFYAKIPGTIDILRKFTEIIYNGECDMEDLIFETNISKYYDEYKQFNNQVAALKQFRQEGVEINPGQNVRYIITNHKSKDFRRRVIIPELIVENTQYDKVKYYEHLLRATETILLPFGYSTEKLNEIIERKTQKKLFNYGEMQAS